jgi:hypothetical protein
MAAFFGKPWNASPQWAHPLLNGATGFWSGIHGPAVPPRDDTGPSGSANGVLSNLGASGVNPPVPTSGPFGSALLLPTNAQQIRWADRGNDNINKPCTLFAVLRVDSLVSNPFLFQTSINTAWVAFGIHSTAGFLCQFANGNSGNWGGGAPTIGDWYGVVIAPNFPTGTANFWVLDYTTGLLKTRANVVVTTPGTVTGGDRIFTLNPNSTKPFAGAVSGFGFTTALWTEAEALSYLADPSAPFRPRRLRAGQLAAVVPASGGGPALFLNYRRRRAG